MKKRLRKKLRLGEFQELGFTVVFQLSHGLTDAEVDAFWDNFVTEAIEEAGLLCGGACGREWDVFITRTGRQSANEADRQALAAWLQECEEVSDIQVGPLVDAWN